MAFIGIVLVAIFGLICLAIVFMMILFLVIGILKIRKGKKSAIVFFILAGIIFAIMFLGAVFLFAPKPQKIETPTGEIEVMPGVISDLTKAIKRQDIAELDELLSEHPALIYYLDVNSKAVIEHGMCANNVEMVECAIEHGARFDEELTYEPLIYDYSFDYYFSDLIHDRKEQHSETYHEDVLKMVQTMLKHGAAVQFPKDERTGTALHSALWWVCCDDSIEEEDLEIIKLLLANGCAVTDTNSQGRTPADEFELAMESYEMQKSCEGYDEVMKLLSVE